MNYVIIGNSAAGVSCVQAVREYDREGEITVISEEKESYSRPMISYLLCGKVRRQDIVYRPKDFYKDNKVDLISGAKAVKLELKQRKVVLSGRQKVGFDKLLIATGGLPIVPPIKGAGAGGVYTFVHLADEEKIAKYIQSNKVKQAVVIGGGLIGLKVSEALLELGIKVSIVELADRILSASLDRKASGIIERALQKAGSNLFTNNTAEEIKAEKNRAREVVLNPEFAIGFEENGLTSCQDKACEQKNRRRIQCNTARTLLRAQRSHGKKLETFYQNPIANSGLKDKRRISADLVILAIGVRPNIELVKGTPVKTNKGILVDKYMRTNIPGIYAAGDCAEGRDLVLNACRPIAIWPAAVRQGRIAGLNMAGTITEDTGSFAMNAVELCGVPVISVGESCPAREGSQALERYEPEKGVYKKVVLRDNRITGAILAGDIERAGLYTGLLNNQVDVSDFKDCLLKDDFGLLTLPQTYRKHLVSAGEAAVI